MEIHIYRCTTAMQRTIRQITLGNRNQFRFRFISVQTGVLVLSEGWLTGFLRKDPLFRSGSTISSSTGSFGDVHWTRWWTAQFSAFIALGSTQRGLANVYRTKCIDFENVISRLTNVLCRNIIMNNIMWVKSTHLGTVMVGKSPSL